MWVVYRQATADIVPPVAASETPPDIASTSVICGTLKLTFINPGALLEDNTRIYKLLGEGFCSDTLISISGGAFVGNDPSIDANGQPIEVSNDGTWLTVYISVTQSPNDSGQTITVHNPDGSEASLFVSYQR
jgi:hypothetical protein